MMDWTGKVRLLSKIKCLGSPKMQRSLYVASTKILRESSVQHRKQARGPKPSKYLGQKTQKLAQSSGDHGMIT
jgi:hypothetical protein